MANLSDKVAPSGVLTPTGDGSGLTGVVTIDANGDVRVPAVNSTTDTRTFFVESEGYAVININGDISDTGGETGGAAVNFSVDAGLTSAVVSLTQNENGDGLGGTFAGTRLNSLVVGTLSDSDIYFGVGRQAYVRLNDNGFYAGGILDDSFTANNTSGSGTVLRHDGRLSALCDNDTALNIGRHSGTGEVAKFYYSGSVVGEIAVNSSNTSYNTSSDYRLKENVTPVQGASDIVKVMRPCTYTAISDGLWYDGFLAHELQDVLPRAVNGTKDAMVDEEYEITPATKTEEAVMGTRSIPNMQSVDYSKLTPLLVASLQEALVRIDALEAAIDRMK